jgi:hypothetical protein
MQGYNALKELKFYDFSSFMARNNPCDKQKSTALVGPGMRQLYT